MENKTFYAIQVPNKLNFRPVDNKTRIEIEIRTDSTVFGGGTNPTEFAISAIANENWTNGSISFSIRPTISFHNQPLTANQAKRIADWWKVSYLVLYKLKRFVAGDVQNLLKYVEIDISEGLQIVISETKQKPRNPMVVYHKSWIEGWRPNSEN